MPQPSITEKPKRYIHTLVKIILDQKKLEEI